MSDEQRAEAADDPEEEAAEDAPGAEAEEGFSEGDFVRLEYTIRTVEDGNVVDTTDEELAEEEGLDTEQGEFGPRTVVLGAGHVFPSVEEALYGEAIGATGTVEVPATEAFGEYDPDQVRTVSADRIPEEQRRPGGHVQIDQEHGHVETIIGGRARVDFNHPLAGEDLEYEYEVVGVVEDRLERAEELLGTFIDVDLEMSIETDEEEEPVYDDEGEEEGTETVEYETLYIEATPQLSMNQQWLFSKQQIASELIDRVGVDRVIIREVIDGAGGMMGGMGGFEEAMEDIDADDVDAEEIVEELDADVPEEAAELEDEPEE